MPARPKTDKLDAIWLAKLAERGMLRPSFVPPKPIRQLRDLTRARTALTADRTKYANRIQALLEDACLKISDKDGGPTDLFGVSGRAMLEALIAGERNPRTLAELARGRMRTKIPTLIEALTGHFENHHARLIRMWLDDYDRLTGQIDQLTAWIEAAITQIDPPTGPDDDHPSPGSLLDRLDEIPGVGRDTAAVIIAEIGTDMTVFPTGAHLASWAHLTPRTHQSGATEKPGRTGKGNNWLKGPLGQAAVSASTTKTFLGARYRRIAKHAPRKKAQVAIARNILQIAWHLIANPDQRFTDLGPDWHDRHTNKTRATRQAIRQLEHLGFTVTLTPTTAA